MPQPLKIIFLGTPEFACPTLQKLLADQRFHVQAVITQQDQKIGRKQLLTASPVKELALKHQLPVFQPIKLSKDQELINHLKALQPDFLVVVAYGQIVSQQILDIPKIKPINIHGSILPLYRGASPIEQALLNRDEKTGISIMEMTLKMDQGPVYRVHEIKITPSDNNQTLRQQLSQIGAEKLTDCLVKIADNTLKPIPQEEALATYCQKINKLDGLINPGTETLANIFGKLQAFTPWPGIYLTVQGKQLKIIQAIETQLPSINPGTFQITDQQIFLNCQDQQLQILELQLEGKKALLSKDFLLGNAKLFEIQY